MAANTSLPRRARAIALVLALAATSACSALGMETAYCQPKDPVVTPQLAAPGDELHVEVPGNVDGVNCEPDLPTTATYEISVLSDAPAEDPDDGLYRAPLGSLDPDDDGDAEGTFRLPEGMPPGRAVVSADLQGAPTVCDLDPDLDCAPGPRVPIEVGD